MLWSRLHSKSKSISSFASPDFNSADVSNIPSKMFKGVEPDLSSFASLIFFAISFGERAAVTTIFRTPIVITYRSQSPILALMSTYLYD